MQCDRVVQPSTKWATARLRGTRGDASTSRKSGRWRVVSVEMPGDGQTDLPQCGQQRTVQQCGGAEVTFSSFWGLGLRHYRCYVVSAVLSRTSLLLVCYRGAFYIFEFAIIGTQAGAPTRRAAKRRISPPPAPTPARPPAISPARPA